MVRPIPAQERYGKIVRFGVVLALSGALWASFGHDGCRACRQASETIRFPHIGFIGIMFYGALTGLLFSKKHNAPFVSWLVFAALGAHIVLVTFLLRLGTFCPACFLAAAGAALAAFGCLMRSDFAFRRDGWTLPLAAVATILLIHQGQKVQRLEDAQQGQALLNEILKQQIAVADGSARIIVYVRTNCLHCASFKTNCLPILHSAFTNRLTVEIRNAPDNLPTPTVLVLGSKPTYLVGNQPCTTFRRAVDQAAMVAPRKANLTTVSVGFAGQNGMP
jgi:hypothetical protein